MIDQPIPRDLPWRDDLMGMTKEQYSEYLCSIGVNPDRTKGFRPCDACHQIVDTIASTTFRGEWLFVCLDCIKRLRQENPCGS